jgi:plasmid stability protein
MGSVPELSMPVNLSIKNVPDALAEKLRARAERNHRSLQRELMAILERAADGEPVPLPPGAGRRTGEGGTPGERLSIDQLAERARQLFPKGSPGSVDLIREMRDGRYGANWARGGGNPGRR